MRNCGRRQEAAAAAFRCIDAMRPPSDAIRSRECTFDGDEIANRPKFERLAMTPKQIARVLGSWRARQN
jgi:hypothetical protein